MTYVHICITHVIRTYVFKSTDTLSMRKTFSWQKIIFVNTDIDDVHFEPCPDRADRRNLPDWPPARPELARVAGRGFGHVRHRLENRFESRVQN
jgi:hypothetical protein